MTTRTRTCRLGCGASIEMARVWKLDELPQPGRQQTWMPIDLTPYARDDVLATAAVSGSSDRKVRILRKGEEPNADEDRRMPHAATCTKRAEAKAKAPVGQGTIDLTPGKTAATPPSLEVLMAELDNLVGLDGVKTEIQRQTAMIRSAKLREAAGLRVPAMTRHLVFTGNPGTGKTTVARLVAGLYRALGILTQGQLVEVDRSGLVGEYIGHTAKATHRAIDSALGGVLFIDEAYSLAPEDSPRDYGSEAIDALVKGMEDHRDDLVVIAAGYPLEMHRFINSNPGLASRFRTTIHFSDYDDAELTEVFARLADASDYAATLPCLQQLLTILERTPRGDGFGNGRFARNLLEEAIARQAWRLLEIPKPTPEQLRELLPEDLPGGAA